MYQYKLDNTGIVVLMMLSNTLGTMAILMMYLQYQCFKQNCLGATLNADKVYHLLGNGVPTDSALEHLWYNTKVKSDNTFIAGSVSKYNSLNICVRHESELWPTILTNTYGITTISNLARLYRPQLFCQF